jgi:hypothetical protein
MAKKRRTNSAFYSFAISLHLQASVLVSSSVLNKEFSLPTKGVINSHGMYLLIQDYNMLMARFLIYHNRSENYYVVGKNLTTGKIRIFN